LLKRKLCRLVGLDVGLSISERQILVANSRAASRIVFEEKLTENMPHEVFAGRVPLEQPATIQHSETGIAFANSPQNSLLSSENAQPLKKMVDA